jgi:hypothetical protein
MAMKEIFYYVRNNVDYEPYLDVMAGPNWTLVARSGEFLRPGSFAFFFTSRVWNTNEICLW